jgi:hypothetical protein
MACNERDGAKTPFSSCKHLVMAENDSVGLYHIVDEFKPDLHAAHETMIKQAMQEYDESHPGEEPSTDDDFIEAFSGCDVAMKMGEDNPYHAVELETSERCCPKGPSSPVVDVFLFKKD